MIFILAVSDMDSGPLLRCGLEWERCGTSTCTATLYWHDEPTTIFISAASGVESGPLLHCGPEWERCGASTCTATL